MRLASLGFGLATLCLLASSAHASTFTQSVAFGPRLGDYNNSVGITAGPLGTQLYLFDSNGGTLNSITFSYNYSFSSTITLINASLSSSTGSVYAESGAQFGSSKASVTTALNNAVNRAGSVRNAGQTLSPAAYDVAGNRSTFSLSPGASQTFTSQGSGLQGLFTDTSAADLAAFSTAGGGSFTPLFSTLTYLNLSNSGGNTLGFQDLGAQGKLSLTYDYTIAATPPVAVTPEPSSLLLLGTGLLGVAGAARRRFC